MKRAGALMVTAVLCAGVAVLLVIERSAGAGDYGTRSYVAPCNAPADPFPGGGIDATFQRIALSALNGAACELGTSREELILSLAPRAGVDKVQWDRPTIERALRTGLERAIDDAVDRDTLPSWAAAALRFIVREAPVDWILDQLGIDGSG